MTPASFDYHAPRSVADAIQLLGQLGPDAKLLAGGHSLLPMMKLRFAQPSHLIDLGRIADLRGIAEVGRRDPHRRHDHRERHCCAPRCWPRRCRCWSRAPAGSPTRRCATSGTIGGDISHGDPGNDHPALMLALDASFVLTGPRGERVVKADGFFLGLYRRRS